MATISIDASDLRRLIRQLDQMQAKLPQAIARGLNEGGDKVRTQTQRALQKQTGLTRYASVTKRVRTARAFPGGMNYSIIVPASRRLSQLNSGRGCQRGRAAA